MRIALARNEGNRMPFKATFAFYEISMETGPNGRILLQDIKYGTDQLIADHVWIHDNPSIKKMADLDEGDIIRFTALVYKYSRDYQQNKEGEASSDYGLKDIQNLVILTKGQRGSSRLLNERQRESFSGIFIGCELNTVLGPRILLKDIIDTHGRRIASHGSIRGTIKDIFPVKEGDQIRFTAVVRHTNDPWPKNAPSENNGLEHVGDVENLTNKPGCLS
ncbi:hypothetical protein FKB36_07255 [Methanoculleus sp. Afa-1]|uniref:Uncharacterized protein n=1 Tax=Methanoculleus formosensis TaxID=2590886 RepID=A0A9E4ZKY7_9EURY|nr:hypothetical protein [Methanoculleus sp. Afa-1]MCT8337297.1 hypothetical protein [Methanoculleus sp. Afa-1]